jgi:hypothetical protein
MFFDQTIYNTAVAILTAIVTGGFVLVFVEIGNRKNRENDNYRQLMSPFLKKLSAYFRYVNWMNNRIIYPKDKNANEQEFHYILNKMAKYGSRLIVSGGDYSVRSFSAKKLSEICYEINNIWYSTLILSAFCGMLVYIAVEGFNVIEHHIGKYLVLILAIAGFIICGFEHSIANMFYYFLAGNFSVEAFISILLIVIGNSIGGLFIPSLKMLMKKIEK